MALVEEVLAVVSRHHLLCIEWAQLLILLHTPLPDIITYMYVKCQGGVNQRTFFSGQSTTPFYRSINCITTPVLNLVVQNTLHMIECLVNGLSNVGTPEACPYAAPGLSPALWPTPNINNTFYSVQSAKHSIISVVYSLYFCSTRRHPA